MSADCCLLAVVVMVAVLGLVLFNDEQRRREAELAARHAYPDNVYDANAHGR